jgi:Tetratricopeptide repeat
MDSWKTRLILSASVVCLAGGCATGQQASLDIRNLNDVQATPVGERSIEHGKVLLRRGQYADAISAFRTALREETGSAEAHNGLAVAYDAIGRKDLARRYFELAVAEQPQDSRYRNNLAHFFEDSGQPELAEGLRDAPAHLVNAELTSSEVPILQLASATVEPLVLDEAVGNDIEVDDLVATIMAGLSDRVAEQEQSAVADGTVILAALPLTSTNAPVQSKTAVMRSTVTPTIKAAPIQLSGQQAPHRDPLDDRFALVADLLRSERRQAMHEGPYIERTSLGEVTLVTQPMLPSSKMVIDFDRLEDQLAIWADDEKRSVEYQRSPGLKGRLAIQHAVERAAIDEAIASTVSLATLVEQIDRDFVYHFFDDDAAAAQEADA